METKIEPTVEDVQSNLAEAFEKAGVEYTTLSAFEEIILEDPAKSRMNATVRCDKCSAQAYVEVILKSGLPLYFCLHDSKEVRSAIKPHLKSWYSEEVKLTWDRHKGTENS